MHFTLLSNKYWQIHRYNQNKPVETNPKKLWNASQNWVQMPAKALKFDKEAKLSRVLRRRGIEAAEAEL